MDRVDGFNIEPVLYKIESLKIFKGWPMKNSLIYIN